MKQASAGAVAGPRVSIPRTEVHSLTSRHVGQDFELWIAHPVPGAKPLAAGPRQVLYVLDANLFFGTAVEMTRIMSQLFGELPPLVVVGIAYPTEDGALQAELRARDFTPTDDAGFAAMSRGVPGGREPTLPEGERLGRAAEFRAFLRDEARPCVESLVDVAAGGNVIFGSSLGGLFVVDSLLEEPDLFDAWIAVSPGLWWGDGIVFEKEERLSAQADDLAACLVLAVGGLEEDARIPMLAEFKMVTNVHLLAERLGSRGYGSLETWTYELDGESHTSVVPVAMTRGLRAVLASAPAR